MQFADRRDGSLTELSDVTKATMDKSYARRQYMSRLNAKRIARGAPPIGKVGNGATTPSSTTSASTSRPARVGGTYTTSQRVLDAWRRRG